MHPDFALLRKLAANIAQAANLSWGSVGFGANDTGAWMAGAVPHRAAGGAATSGQNAQAMQSGNCDTLVLMGSEPESDFADPQLTAKALKDARVVALSAYHSPVLMETADVILPIAVFAETSGTFVNLQGDVQSFTGATSPVGEARPAWKVLRVLGNLLDVDGFDFLDSNEVRDEALALCADLKPDNALNGAGSLAPSLSASGLQRIGGVPIYASDAIVRRSDALQHTPDSWHAVARLNCDLAASLSVADGDAVRISQGEGSAEMKIRIDDAVPDNCVWLPSAVPETSGLGCGFGEISVEKV